MLAEAYHRNPPQTTIMIEKLKVVERHKTYESTWNAELARLKKVGTNVDQAGRFRVLFGSAQGLSEDYEKNDRSCLLPPEFLDSVCKDLNGLYGNRFSRSGAAAATSSSVWYAFKIKNVSTCGRAEQLSYTWDQIACFVTHIADTDLSFVVCLDCPKDVQWRLIDKLQALESFQIGSWHEIFLGAVRDLYDRSVWALRDCIRSAERTRTVTSLSQGFQPDFVYLHEIARHVIHSNETLDVAIDTVERVQRDWSKQGPSGGAGDLDSLEKISALEKDVKSIKRRSESLHERLHNEINLAFNLVAQRDSQMIVRMSEESRQDNNNVRSIAVVGLVYLPGTFVSGLFGMNFFDFSDESGHQSWKVSDKLWIYWVITLPLTLVTILVWVLAFHGQALRWPIVGRKEVKGAAKINGV